MRNTKEICQELMEHLKEEGHELLEKNYKAKGQIKCSVFCIIGPRAEEMTAMVREWAHNNGLKRTR